jgi:hypothetical protein
VLSPFLHDIHSVLPTDKNHLLRHGRTRDQTRCPPEARNILPSRGRPAFLGPCSLVKVLPKVQLTKAFCIQFENILFRVHRYFFERESKFFREQLSIPAVPGEQARGASESSALVFDDVTSTDFERLLWVFYNTYVEQGCQLTKIVTDRMLFSF